MIGDYRQARQAGREALLPELRHERDIALVTANGENVAAGWA